MYKKNKVNLRNIKKLMSGKTRVQQHHRRSYVENLMDITSKKLESRQKEIDKRQKKEKILQKERQKNILY